MDFNTASPEKRLTLMTGSKLRSQYFKGFGYKTIILAAVTAGFLFCQAKAGISRSSDEEDALITIHAAVIKAPFELFYERAGDFVKPNPDRVKITAILNALARSEAIMVSKATTVCRAMKKCECKKMDRVNSPVEKTVTGRGTEPYVITEYTWLEESLHFITTSLLKPDDSILLDFSYDYKAPRFYFDNSTDDKKVIKDSRIVWSASIILDPLAPVIAGTAVDQQSAAFLVIYAEVPK